MEEYMKLMSHYEAARVFAQFSRVEEVIGSDVKAEFVKEGIAFLNGGWGATRTTSALDSEIVGKIQDHWDYSEWKLVDLSRHEVEFTSVNRSKLSWNPATGIMTLTVSPLASGKYAKAFWEAKGDGLTPLFEQFELNGNKEASRRSSRCAKKAVRRYMAANKKHSRK